MSEESSARWLLVGRILFPIDERDKIRRDYVCSIFVGKKKRDSQRSRGVRLGPKSGWRFPLFSEGAATKSSKGRSPHQRAAPRLAAPRMDEI